jgi:hypothetical protein
MIMYICRIYLFAIITDGSVFTVRYDLNLQTEYRLILVFIHGGLSIRITEIPNRDKLF